MTEKFSYYDLLAYLVPGTLVVWAAIQLAKTLHILEFISTGSTLLDGSAFIVVAFLAGHLVQAEGQRWLDAAHGYSVFPSGFPSRSFLVSGQTDERGKPWCSELRRLAYIAATRRHDLISEEQAGVLRAVPEEEGDMEKAKRTSHEAYRAAFSYLTDEGRAQKAITANQTYGLFRGLAMACAVVTVLFLALFVVGFIESLLEPGSGPGFAGLYLYPILMMVVFSYAAASFRLRARNRGKHHVREVFDAILSASSSRKSTK